MSLNLAALGERLLQARLNVGFSQESAADAIGITRQALIQIEQGSRHQLPELWRLAELYKTDLQWLLAEDKGRDEDSLLALFRMEPALQNEDSTRACITKVYELFRIGFELEQELGEPERCVPTAYAMPAPHTYAEAVAQGRQLAIRERRRLSLGYAPISQLSQIIAAQGIWTADADLPPQFSGLFLSHSTIGSAIIVNCKQKEERRRFSYAHEYLHALVDKGKPATVTTRQNASDLIEKRANAFASEFLMPSAGVQEALDRLQKGASSRVYFGVFDVANDEPEQIIEKRNVAAFQRIQPQDVALLAKNYGVSYQVAAYKLLDMQCIGRSEANDLIERASEGSAFTSMLEPTRMVREPDIPPPPSLHEDTLKAQIARLLVEALRREIKDAAWITSVAEKANLPAQRLLKFAQTDHKS